MLGENQDRAGAPLCGDVSCIFLLRCGITRPLSTGPNLTFRLDRFLGVRSPSMIAAKKIITRGRQSSERQMLETNGYAI